MPVCVQLEGVYLSAHLSSRQVQVFDEGGMRCCNSLAGGGGLPGQRLHVTAESEVNFTEFERSQGDSSVKHGGQNGRV